jgi:hypothetical protein
MADEESAELSEAEYAVYGVLCAAKRETGPEGARHLVRIQMRLTRWTDLEVKEALQRLIDLGWVRQLDPVLGMIHFEAVLDGG